MVFLQPHLSLSLRHLATNQFTLLACIQIRLKNLKHVRTTEPEDGAVCPLSQINRFLCQPKTLTVPSAGPGFTLMGIVGKIISKCVLSLTKSYLTSTPRCLQTISFRGGVSSSYHMIYLRLPVTPCRRRPPICCWSPWWFNDNRNRVTRP